MYIACIQLNKIGAGWQVKRKKAVGINAKIETVELK
jgi:hypothetical protein